MDVALYMEFSENISFTFVDRIQPETNMEALRFIRILNSHNIYRNDFHENIKPIKAMYLAGEGNSAHGDERK